MRVLAGTAGVGAAIGALACGAVTGIAAPTPHAVTDRTLVSIPAHRTSEFTVARDPSNSLHLVAAAMDWDSPSGTVGCASFVSSDGGRTWASGGVVPEFVDARQHVDPWVSIGSNGQVAMTCIAQNANSGGIDRQLLLARSGDGGRTFGAATSVPQLTTGAGTATKDSVFLARDGRLYLCFKETDLEVLVSPDGGTTWMPHKRFTGLSATCNGIVQGPAGDVIVNWQDSGGGSAPDTSFGALASVDRGLTWTVFSPAGLGNPVPSDPPFPQAAAPSLAVSPVTGHVFEAAQQYQQTNAAGNHAAMLLFRSIDDGAHFGSLSLPAIPSSACAGCNQVHPTLTLLDDGRLALELVLSDDQSIHREVWLIVSADEGSTWAAPLLLGSTDITDSYLLPSSSTPSAVNLAMGLGGSIANPAGAPSSLVGAASVVIWPYFHRDGGEYYGISSTPQGIVAMWVDHYNAGVSQVWSRLVDPGAAAATGILPASAPAPSVASGSTPGLANTGGLVARGGVVVVVAVFLLGGAIVLLRGARRRSR